MKVAIRRMHSSKFNMKAVSGVHGMIIMAVMMEMLMAAMMLMCDRIY